MHRNLLPLLYTLLGLFTLAIVVSLGQPPVAKLQLPVVEPERPEAIAEKLGDRDYATREAAMKSLRQMGLAALPAIREALKSDNPEVQRRASELLGQIEYLEKLEPTRVTLQGDGMYLTDALEELTKQTHFHHDIGDQDILPQKHNLNLQNVTYWEAMDHLAIKWNQGVTSNDREKSYSLTREHKRSPFVVNSGPFQIELQGIEGIRNFQFVNLTGNETKPEARLRFDFLIRAEPRLMILRHDPMVLDTIPPNTTQTNPQEDLILFYRNQRYDIGQARTFSEEFRGDWKHASTLKTLKGYLPIHVVVKQTPVLLTEDFLGSLGKSFRIGNEQFKLSRLNADETDIDFQLTFQDQITCATCQNGNRIWLVDRKGKQIERLSLSGVTSLGWGMSSQHILHFSYPRRDPKRAEPLALMFTEWKVVRHLVPFTFHNVPLP